LTAGGWRHGQGRVGREAGQRQGRHGGGELGNAQLPDRGVLDPHPGSQEGDLGEATRARPVPQQPRGAGGQAQHRGLEPDGVLEGTAPGGETTAPDGPHQEGGQRHRTLQDCATSFWAFA